MQIPEYINLKHTPTQKSIPPLKLNLQMLLDEFTEQDFEPLFYNSMHDKMKLDNVLLYYGQDVLEESVVYLCDEQILAAYPIQNHDICLLLIGHKKPLFPDLKNPFLFFKDQEPAVILNLASKFFRKYRNFEIDLYEALYTGGLSALSSVALAFFKNPILIHNEKFMVLSRPQFVSGMTSKENALKTLGYYKWQENDAFVCAKISIPEQDRRINSVDIMMTSLRLLFTGCYAFMDGSVIWLVENLTTNRLSDAAFQKRLRSFAKDGAYSIGQSAPFRNFFHLPHAFRQADITLEYGKKIESSFCHTFHEIIGNYMIGKLCENENKETLCHECLFYLMDYDSQKGTDYYKTLQIYLENERNLTITSQILHIHRSTLQYRITKITELLSLPLDDADLRFYLLCCFKIIAYQKE